MARNLHFGNFFHFFSSSHLHFSIKNSLRWWFDRVFSEKSWLLARQRTSVMGQSSTNRLNIYITGISGDDFHQREIPQKHMSRRSFLMSLSYGSYSSINSRWFTSHTCSVQCETIGDLRENSELDVYDGIWRWIVMLMERRLTRESSGEVIVLQPIELWNFKSHSTVHHQNSHYKYQLIRIQRLKLVLFITLRLPIKLSKISSSALSNNKKIKFPSELTNLRLQLTSLRTDLWLVHR
jgi:hypothetical protein